jgi:hypothetical protein
LSKDQTTGLLILVVAIVALVAYSWLLYVYPTLVLQITAWVAVAAICTIVAWIGYTMVTTPPPAPLEIPTEKTTSPETAPTPEKASG